MYIYVGYDQREKDAYEVAVHSANKHAAHPIHIHALDSDRLYDMRMLWRPITKEKKVMRDHLSNAPQSTEFASSRFLVPHLHRTGWALFCDCDVVFMGDINEIMEYADPQYAVMVVKHDYTPKTEWKMDGQPQLRYTRKNWSSVILWNCDHLANQRLDIGMVNWWPGELLHKFCWLKDSEIGELHPRWNWLVNETPMPEQPMIAHFTLGGPWLDGWGKSEHDEVWLNAFRDSTT